MTRKTTTIGKIVKGTFVALGAMAVYGFVQDFGPFAKEAYNNHVGMSALEQKCPDFEFIRGDKYGKDIYGHYVRLGDSAWSIQEKFHECDAKDMYYDDFTHVVDVHGNEIGDLIQPEQKLYISTYLKPEYDVL
jgi:hypothetical protein